MNDLDIIKIVDDFSSETGLKPSTICQYANRNHRLYEKIKKGRYDREGAKRLINWIEEQRKQRAAEKSAAA